MVAVIVMGVGLLGLAGTASYVAMQIGGGQERTVAASVAQQVYDSLAARRCDLLAAGSDSIRQVRVWWDVIDSGAVIYVRQSVRFKTRRGYKTTSYSSMLACRNT